MHKIIKLNDCQTPVSLLNPGPGTAIVLLHGGPAAFDYLESLALLLPAEFTSIRYDQRGGGDTSSTGIPSLVQLIADLEALRQQLRLESWVVMGHSWGAFLALAYAVAHAGATRALGLLNSSGLDADWQKTYQLNRRKKLSPAEQIEYLHLRQELSEVCGGSRGQLEKRLQELNFKADFHDPAKLDQLGGLLAYTPWDQAYQALMKDWSDALAAQAFVQAASSLAMPTLVLHGESDPRGGQGAEALVHSLPQAKYAAITEAGHYPWLEQPEQVQAVLKDFLASF